MSFWTWLLRLLGFLPNEGETYIVAGQVLKGERAAFAGRVALFGRVENETVRIGETVSDSEGRYSLRYRVPGALRSAQVAVFDGDGQRIAESDSFTPSGLDIIHIKIGLSAGTFTVSGQVKSATRPGMSDLRVVIVDRDEVPLGGSQHAVSGKVKNEGGQEARGVAVTIRVVEPTQGEECLTDEIAVSPSTLAAGEEGSFSADFDHPCFLGPTQSELGVEWD